MNDEIKADDLHRQWMETRPGYKAAYDALEEEYTLAAALIQARAAANLTQGELAQRMNTTQTAIARLESGRIKPTTRTLEKLAEATGLRLRISFEPMPGV